MHRKLRLIVFWDSFASLSIKILNHGKVVYNSYLPDCYNNVLWGPSYILDNQKIERIQHKATIIELFHHPLTILLQIETLKLSISTEPSTKE